ncbi:MAG: DUF4233 domain-containing protein [Nocardioidaceae bacterium]
MRSPRRTMCASVLAFESIVLGLATPVLITVQDVSKPLALSLGLGLAIVAVVIAGLLRAEWAYYLGFALQAAALGMGFLVSAMFALGVIFGLLWTMAYVLGKKIEAQQAAWSDSPPLR